MKLYCQISNIDILAFYNLILNKSQNPQINEQLVENCSDKNLLLEFRHICSYTLLTTSDESKYLLGTKLLQQCNEKLKSELMVPSDAEGNPVHEAIIINHNSECYQALANCLKQPSFEVNDIKIKLNKGKNKTEYFCAMDGKEICLTPKDRVNAEEGIRKLIDVALKDQSKITWRSLSRYLIMPLSAKIHQPDETKKEVLDLKSAIDLDTHINNQQKTTTQLMGDLCKVLKHQQQDLLLAISSTINSHYYFHYHHESGKLFYIKNDFKPLDKINEELKVKNISEVFPDIFLQQIQSGIDNRKDIIKLPSNLVHEVSNNDLLANKNLKCGLNVSADFFKIDARNNVSSLKFKHEIPGSCIQHTELLLARAHGEQVQFDYKGEVDGNPAKYGGKMCGKFTAMNNSQIEIDYSNDDVMNYLDPAVAGKGNTPQAKVREFQLPKYGEGLSLLATKVNKYNYNMHFSTCLGVIANSKGVQIGALMSDVSEGARFLDYKLGNHKYAPITLSAIQQDYTIDNVEIEALQENNKYSGRKLDSSIVKINRSNIPAKAIIKFKFLKTFIYLFKADKELYWLQPKQGLSGNKVKLNANDFIGDKLKSLNYVDPFVIGKIKDFHVHQQSSEPENFFQANLVEYARLD